jgi:hypothetical protein
VLFYSEEHRIQFRYASWQACADELSQRFHHAAQRPPERPASFPACASAIACR